MTRREVWRFSELAKETGIPASTLHGRLRSLEVNEFIVHRGEKKKLRYALKKNEERLEKSMLRLPDTLRGKLKRVFETFRFGESFTKDLIGYKAGVNPDYPKRR